MNNGKPFIHLFKTMQDAYIYDVNTNTILPVENDVFQYLDFFLSHKLEAIHLHMTREKIQKAESCIKSMQEEGFLSNKRVKTIKHPLDKYLDGLLEFRMENLILQVTQACNLRCNYCTYSGKYINRTHSTLHMPEETAKKAIDYFIAHSRETPKPAFSFYGGEPFLNFTLIKKALKYIDKRIRGKEYSIHITTNGTIMNEEIVRFLVEKQVSLLISLDGPEETHNRNRCFGSGRGSFKEVIQSIEMIKSFAPEYAAENIRFSAVISDDGNFCSLSRFFMDYNTVRDFDVLASSTSDYYLKDSEQKKINYQYYDDIDYEILKYMLYKAGRLNAPDVSKIVMLWEERERTEMEEKRIMQKVLPDNFHPGGPCVPGMRRLFVTISGDLFPCERVSEISKAAQIGTLDSGIDKEKARKILNIGCLTENECKQCWASRFCTACVSSADNGTELDREIKLSYCRDIRLNTERKFIKYCIFKEFNISTQEQGVH